MIKSYLKNIASTTVQGDAREESYYPKLSEFLDEFAKSIDKNNISITTLPKKTEAGNPDFRVWDGRQHIVGYIEAKKPGENLDVIETTNQLKRYRSTFPNLILTDFYEFRLYRNGQLIDKVSIGRPFIARRLQSIPPIENEEKFVSLLEKFFAFSLPKVFSAENLAKELASRTRFLRDEVINKELEEEEQKKGRIYGFYEAFKKYLVSNLSQKDFADIYSQTITYGLFAARTRAGKEFNRELAYKLIPPTIGILRDVFEFISLGKAPQQMEVIIDDIAEVLQVADVNTILNEYYKKRKGEDPIVHFYETFLNIYDPATSEKRGVYYTPEPVVKYIVRSVHSLLKTHFKLEDGLASKEVTLLDPAAGTLTFPAEAIKLAVQEFTDKYGDGGKNNFIKNQLLKNFYAFELMMAPYAIGHLKISFLLEELGYTMQEDDRFKLYLTNTLDMEDLQQTQIPGLESLSEESHEAGKVKQNEPILVILGNPPYSANSANYNEWTEKLTKEDIDGATSYYKVDGEPLGEQNSKLLQDDYVKFLRFAQWKIQKAGEGIVAMITNHSYLTNPTFRGMRQSLMNTFNEMYIIDLHGDSLKRETADDRSKDENVFDIRKGVAISIMVKRKKVRNCKVFHKDIKGLRSIKYDWLANNNFKVKDYEILHPKTPWYLLTQTNTKEIAHYNTWISLTAIFPVNSSGIKTHRDDLVIAFTASELENRMRQFRNLKFEELFIQESYKIKETSDWNIRESRKAAAADKNFFEKIYTISYRPFDTRFIIYSDDLIGRPRKEVMQHMLYDNIALMSGRQGQVVGDEFPWNLSFISDSITDVNAFYRGGIVLFPLYLYPTEQKKKSNLQSMMVFEPDAEYGKKGKKPNIALKVFEQLEKAYKKKPTPEQLLYYIYAVLYSNAYRTKYAEFLKIDFPRIPFTSNYEVFKEAAKLGEQLTELHLLKHKSLNHPTVKYFGKGNSDTIEKPVYNADEKRVYINTERYFDNVTTEVWNYHIGGYQVMEKYLKDRKARRWMPLHIIAKWGLQLVKPLKWRKSWMGCLREWRKILLKVIIAKKFSIFVFIKIFNMEMPVKSKVEEISLRPNELLLPLFEVIVNSIISISSLNSKKNGLIKISIEREKKEGLFDYNLLVNVNGDMITAPIRNIKVVDNGIGFNDKNFQSFNTAYSQIHKDRGCKGVGRFTMLACFDKITINSVYKKEGVQWCRDFTFDAQDEVNPKNGNPKICANPVSGETSVTLQNYHAPFKLKSSLSIKDIAKSIIDDCLPFFLNENVPTVILNDDSADDEIILNDILKEAIEFDGKSSTFSTTNSANKFHIQVIRRKDGRMNRLKLCAHNRVVGKTRNLSSLMPEFENAMKDDQGQLYFIDVYVTSPFFDSRVNTIRNSFNIIDEMEEGNLFKEITMKEIEEGIIKDLTLRYKTVLEYFENETLSKVKRFILDPKKLRVRYRSLLSRPDLLKKIPYNAFGDKIEEYLIRIKINLERELSHNLKNALKKTQPEDFSEYSQIIRSYLDQEAKFAKDKLADLVIHRRGVLNLLKRLLKLSKDGKYALEEDMHNLIFPMGQTDDSLPFDYHNLWILDERLAFHSYVSSDKKLSSNPHVKLNSKKEADLLIFDFPWAFSENEKELSSMVVFEFKRPGRDLNNEGDKKLDILVMKYFEDLMENKARDEGGELLNLEDTTPKFGFIICDIDKGLADYNIRFNDFKKTPFGTLYKIIPPLNLHIEAMNYQQMISMSEKKHLAFFKELGIEE